MAKMIYSDKDLSIRNVEYMIQNGWDLNTQYENEGNILHGACHYGHLEIVQLLLRRGNPDINSRTLCIKHTPLHFACQYGHSEIAKLLIDNGAEVNPLDENGQTPLYFACVNNHAEIVKILIEASSPNIVNDITHNYTYLHMACLHRRPEIVKILIENGADKSIRNHNGELPIDIVRRCGIINNDLLDALYPDTGSRTKTA